MAEHRNSRSDLPNTSKVDEQNGKNFNDGNTNDGDTNDGSANGNKNWFEWTVFAVSSLLILGVIGALAWQQLNSDSTPPHVEIAIIERRTLREQKEVAFHVVVSNRGGTTAHGVEVEVSWPRANQSSQFTIDHLPREGRRDGWAVFSFNGEPPTREDLRTRVRGYEE